MVCVLPVPVIDVPLADETVADPVACVLPVAGTPAAADSATAPVVCVDADAVMVDPLELETAAAPVV